VVDIFLLPLPPPASPIAPARSQLRPSAYMRPSPHQSDVGHFDAALLRDPGANQQGGPMEGGPGGTSRDETRRKLFLASRFSLLFHTTTTDRLYPPAFTPQHPHANPSLPFHQRILEAATDFPKASNFVPTCQAHHQRIKRTANLEPQRGGQTHAGSRQPMTTMARQRRRRTAHDDEGKTTPAYDGPR
jgi:hypothetical protein